MPLIDPSYRPPPGLGGGHAQTVLARSLRRLGNPPYQRQRLELGDGDFLDLDEIDGRHDRTAILLHGLESCSRAPYVIGMGRCLLREKWNIVALNFRGCSGVPNRLLRSYHSGVSDDLAAVVADLRHRRPGTALALVGFSLGGNVALRHLGERGEEAKSHGIVAAAAISVPCDLESCAERFRLPENRFYMKRFLHCLFRKVRHRQEAFPDALDYEAVLASRDFHDFDGRFTAPIHGFTSAKDYWSRCSSRSVARRVEVPTLLINALDDPFLSERCHLRDDARDHPLLHVDLPSHGGHVGFVNLGRTGYYHERRVTQFFHETVRDR